MFDALKTAGALAGLMKNKDAIKQAADRVGQKLADTRVIGSAGAGAVRVAVSGQLKILSVELNPSLASSLGDPVARAMAEGLIAEAANDAMRQAREVVQREVSREAQALGLNDLPGLDKILAGGLG